MNYPEFPTSYTDDPVLAADLDLDTPGRESVDRLAANGLEVKLGVQRQDREDMIIIACQDPSLEYCLNDLKRLGVADPKTGIPFGPKAGEQRMESWLGEGRLMSMLHDIGSKAVAGYGWLRQEECPELPDCDNTFAVRVDQHRTGNKVGQDFTNVILSASAALLGPQAQNVGFEAWSSNGSAVGTYLRTSGQLVRVKDDYRPTLKADDLEKRGSSLDITLPNRVVTTHKRRDTRLFMKFGRTMTQPQA
jgi:hypothetical protein